MASSLAASDDAPGHVFRDRLHDGLPGPEMVVVPAGRFIMGSAVDEPGRDPDEGPQRSVTIARPFAVGRYELTFAEYDRFCDATGRERPSDRTLGRGRRPVFRVSWEDAMAYTRWLSRQTGKRYRLPSEGEWEYAARAGSQTARFWAGGLDDACRYANGDFDRCNDGYRFSAPVGSFEPNAFGLYDMLGNVREWTHDCWNPDYRGAPTDGSARLSGDCTRRLNRGGSFYDDPERIRAAFRSKDPPDLRQENIGIRLARDLD